MSNIEFRVVTMSTKDMVTNQERLGLSDQDPVGLYAFSVISRESIMRHQINQSNKFYGEIALNNELIPPEFMRYYRLHEVVELMQKAKWYETNIDSPPLDQALLMHEKAIDAEYRLALRRGEIDEWHKFAMQNGTPEGFLSLLRIGAYEKVKSGTMQ